MRRPGLCPLLPLLPGLSLVVLQAEKVVEVSLLVQLTEGLGVVEGREGGWWCLQGRSRAFRGF